MKYGLRILALTTLFSGCSGWYRVMMNDENQTLSLHTDRRTSASMLMDTSLDLNIQSALQQLNIPEQDRVYVRTFNRHVLVLGQVEDLSLIEKISDIVSSTEGVRQVYNEITPMKSLTYWQQTKDSWITTKVTSSMMMSSQMNPWKIHVITENGVVYLLGIVTPEEEALAIETARKTSGVRKVVTLFDYKSPSVPSSL